MSRIGKMPIRIPQGVTVAVEGNRVTVKGSKGTLSQEYKPLVEIDLQGDVCQVRRKNDSRQARSMHGLYRKLIHNMVVGVSQGFTRVLAVNGVGYRAEVRDDALVLNLGYSNPKQHR